MNGDSPLLTALLDAFKPVFETFDNLLRTGRHNGNEIIPDHSALLSNDSAPFAIDGIKDTIHGNSTLCINYGDDYAENLPSVDLVDGPGTLPEIGVLVFKKDTIENSSGLALKETNQKPAASRRPVVVTAAV